MSHGRLAALLLALAPVTGCVERRFVITVDPPGALVYCNGENVGTAGPPPAGGVDKYFVYYGKYRFTIVKDGYVTLTTDELIATPWYEIPPLDFVSENLYPFRVSDVRRLHFHLEKATRENAGDLLNRSLILKQKGDQVQSPPTAPNAVPATTLPTLPGQRAPVLPTPTPTATPTPAPPLAGSSTSSSGSGIPTPR